MFAVDGACVTTKIGKDKSKQNRNRSNFEKGYQALDKTKRK